MKKHNKGFSLIEIMIVVAIIGILASIASSYYQNYINRSHVAAALYDIFPSKVQVEIRIHDGETTLSPALVGLTTETNNCSNIEVAFNGSTGEALVNCTMKGSPAIINRTIGVSRNTNGLWSCVTGTTNGVTALDPDYIPKGCT